MKELLIPGIKLFVICFAAALSLGFVNEITKDKISEARAEKEKKALSEFEFDGILGNRLVVPPTTIKKEIFQQKIIERLSTEEEKTLLNRVYSVSDTDATLSVSLSPELLVAVAKAITGTGFESGEKIRTMFVVMKENAEAGKVITGYVLEVHGNGYGGDMKIFAFYSPDGTILDSRLVQNNETPGLGKNAEDPAYMNKYKNTSGKAIPIVKSMLTNPDAVSGATITFMGVGNALRDGSRYIASFGVQK